MNHRILLELIPYDIFALSSSRLVTSAIWALSSCSSLFFFYFFSLYSVLFHVKDTGNKYFNYLLTCLETEFFKFLQDTRRNPDSLKSYSKVGKQYKKLKTSLLSSAPVEHLFLLQEIYWLYKETAQKMLGLRSFCY